MDPTFATAIVVAGVSIGGSWFVTRGDRQRVASLERRIDRLEQRALANRTWTQLTAGGLIAVAAERAMSWLSGRH